MATDNKKPKAKARIAVPVTVDAPDNSLQEKVQELQGRITCLEVDALTDFRKKLAKQEKKMIKYALQEADRRKQTNGGSGVIAFTVVMTVLTVIAICLSGSSSRRSSYEYYPD